MINPVVLVGCQVPCTTDASPLHLRMRVLEAFGEPVDGLTHPRHDRLPASRRVTSASYAARVREVTSLAMSMKSARSCMVQVGCCGTMAALRGSGFPPDSSLGRVWVTRTRLGADVFIPWQQATGAHQIDAVRGQEFLEVFQEPPDIEQRGRPVLDSTAVRPSRRRRCSSSLTAVDVVALSASIS